MGGIANYLQANPEMTVVLIAILFALNIMCLILIFVNIVNTSGLKKRYNYFMKGKDGESLENILEKMLDSINKLVESNNMNVDNITKLNEQIQYSFQKMGVIKYDALEEAGGKMSFTVSLLNARNDGYVLNAVHTRDGCYTYLKEIVDGKCVIPLSDEEIEAIQQAMTFQD